MPQPAEPAPKCPGERFPGCGTIARMRGLVAGSAIGLIAACQVGRFFSCSEDADCPGGRCELQAMACSFPDSECPMGHRFGDASHPTIAGECVAPSTGTSDTTDGLADTGATAATTGAGSESFGDDGTAPTSTTGAPSCPPQWWDCAWTQRHRVTLALSPAETIEGAPVLVLLSSARVDHDRMQQDGEDLRFVDADGDPAPFEIERWDPAGVSTVWVALDRIGHAPEAMWMYYGNPVAEGTQDPAAVWGPPHVAVWHMGDSPFDATGSGHDQTPTGAVETVAGQVVDATSFEASSARLDVEPAEALDDLPGSGITLSAWIRPRSFGGGGLGRIVHKDFVGVGWQWYIADGGALRFAVGFDGGAIMWATGGGIIALDRWQHVVTTFAHAPGALPRLYVDGVEHEVVVGGPAPREAPLADADIPLRLGNRVDNARRFDGIIDEVRVEKTVRSPNWIRTQVSSGNDTLLEYGPREALEVVQ